MSAPILRPRLHLMTASRLKTLNACPRQHEYRYERGYVTLVDADALRFGTLIHLGLEAWWKAHMAGQQPDGTPLDVALATVSEHIAAQQRGETDEFEAVRVMALLAGYDAQWSTFAAGCEVLGVEVPFLLPMLHPRTGEPAREWRIAGKMDGVLRLADGRVAVLEHKTSGEETGVGSDYRRRLMLDPQVSQYFEGVRTMTDPQTGEHIVADVCLYDVLQKPAIKPRTATPEADRIYTQPKSRACRECGKKTAPPPPHTDADTGTTCVDGRITTDPGGRLRAGQREHDETPTEYAERVNADIAADLDGYFQHIEVIRLPHEQTTHGFNVWHAARQIWLMRHDGYHRQNPSACVRYGRCAYIDVCEGTARIDDPARFRRIADPHVELADALGALQHQQAEQTTANAGEDR